MDDRERAARNLNPHAEAIAAMYLWSYEYAHKQRGGSMDFWDKLDDRRKRLCKEMVEKIRTAEPLNTP